MITLVRRVLLAYVEDTATHSPTSESVSRRTNDIVVMARVLLIIGGVASSESNDICCVKWRYDRSIGCAFLSSARITNEVAHLSGGQNQRTSDRLSGLKVFKSYGLLLRNHPAECNKLFIRGLETPPRFFGSNPIARICTHYSAIADDKIVALTSLVTMWTPQQRCGRHSKRCGELWLAEFKAATLVKQRVRI
ncbi:uncharacterized protein TNCV_322501 [Trichonephila clavipes]|nr:uncharacterized protein TNCV_322501 [Trichonephila clavipes]